MPAVCGLPEDSRREDLPPIAVPGRIIDFGSIGGKNEFFEGSESMSSSWTWMTSDSRLNKGQL